MHTHFLCNILSIHTTIHTSILHTMPTKPHNFWLVHWSRKWQVTCSCSWWWKIGIVMQACRNQGGRGAGGQLPPQILVEQKVPPTHYYLPPQIFRLCDMPVMDILPKSDRPDALSFYGSKMILDRPNHFGRVPIILDGSNSFWSRPNHKKQPRKV